MWGTVLITTKSVDRAIKEIISNLSLIMGNKGEKHSIFAATILKRLKAWVDYHL